MKNSKTPAPPSSREDGAAPKKRPYRRPELVEYGSVAKLTQGALTMMSEGAGFSMTCL